jgi:hypothetical protein
MNIRNLFIYLFIYFTGLQLYNQIYSAAKVLFKEIANLFVILRNSGDYVEKWKGEYRGEEMRGERTNLETPYYPLSNFYIYQHKT